MTTHLFVGDSITDADRRADPEGLGDGYVRLVGELTGDHVVNRGIAGDRAKDLEARWDVDVLRSSYDTLTVFVGINDTWRRFDAGQETTAEEFESSYRRLLTALPEATRLVIIEPFLLPVSPAQQEWLGDLEGKQRVAAAMASEFGGSFVPLQQIMSRASDLSSAEAIAPDGVHPSESGHRLIAEAWIAVTGTATR